MAESKFIEVTVTDAQVMEDSVSVTFDNDVSWTIKNGDRKVADPVRMFATGIEEKRVKAGSQWSVEIKSNTNFADHHENYTHVLGIWSGHTRK